MFANGRAQLLAMVQAKIDSVLLSDVAPFVESKIKQHIEKDVYSIDTNMPELRRRENDGLIADSNIVSEMIGSGKLMVMNIARNGDSVMGQTVVADSRTQFSRWINNGEWMDLAEFNRSGNKTKRAARPFISNTQDDINSNRNEWLNILRKGMQRK